MNIAFYIVMLVAAVAVWFFLKNMVVLGFAAATDAVTAAKVQGPNGGLIERTLRANADAAAGTLYNGVLMGRDSTGAWVKAHDTAKLLDIGLYIGQRAEVDSAAADGDTKVDVQTGIIVPIKIATLTSTGNADEHLGCPVYALYDNEVQLTRGSYANYVGQIVGYNSVTEVLVYIPAAGVQNQGRGIGTIYNAPQVWDGADEWEEIHLANDGSTSTKPGFRYRVQNSVASTGLVKAFEIQASSGAGASWAGVNVASIMGLSVGAIIKGAAVLSTQMCGLHVKVEDNYATNEQATGGPTLTGEVCVMRIESQVSSNPTGYYSAFRFDCQSAVNGTSAPWDSVFYFPSVGGQNPSIVNLIEFGAASACAVVSAGTYSTADGYFVVKVAGSTYRIAFFAGTD